MSISHVMSGGRYVDAHPRFSTRLFSSRLLACAIAAAAVPAFAADISETGAAGSPGPIGLVGQPGGDGQNAGAILTSHDFFNTAAATGGKGGNGGASLLLVVPGGNGGAGGNATAQQQSANMPFAEFEDAIGEATVTATGGDGGNGGGLIRGNGGVGGAADALSTVDATAGGALGSFILQSTNVSGVGGNGGAGRNGGAGGASTATGMLTGPSDGSSVRAKAQGGDGGAATFNGGRGGNASAVTSYDGGGQPSDNFVVSEAVGGDGGNSLLGRNGNGGNAVATASGRHGSRDLGVSVSANARGGDSGGGIALPLSPQGKGGNAFASATAEAANFPTSAQADAHAQGGAGVLRGGDAVASATARGPFADSSAVAAGGVGGQAGASIATAITTNDYFGFVDASATATSADKFVRGVVVNASVGQDFEANPSIPAAVFTQARTGDTSAVIAQAPAPSVEPGVVARAAAGPGAAEVTASLVGNTAIAGQAAAGTVWGLGDFATNAVDGEGGIVDPFDSIDATTTFTFDVSERSPSNLWLGLLDSSLSADAIGDFHFSLLGEGSTLFEHDFTGSDFLTFFDDRLFDLGAWSSLVSSDGLFDLAVTFSGVVPEIRFAFGDTAGGSTAVPEPSVLAMLLTGLLGIGLARRRR